MTTLAIDGGTPEVIGPIRKFSTIGQRELQNALECIRMDPLSGYLAGNARGGRWVCELEERWAETFKVKHAVACNSATSGLLAAAFAVWLGAGDKFVCPATTMSATAAAPMFTSATPHFVDVEDETFGVNCGPMPSEVKAIFSTNLFGHPSDLGRNEWVKDCGTYLIEDNAQSPFAMAHGRYCGTMGHIGCWSFNVHKHIQCGEGGMCTTDDDELAERMRDFINHGENRGVPIGLNLRMPEVCAAIMLAQLERAEEIIAGRIANATLLMQAVGDIPGLRPPVVRECCRHAFYVVPFLIEQNRAEFCAALRAEGVPIVEGYQEPLYRLPALKQFARPCPVAEDLQDRRLFYFENCSWDPTPEQIRQIGAAFRKVAETIMEK